MKIDTEEFRVRPGHRVQLRRRPTRVRAYFRSKNEYRRMLADHIGQLSKAQECLYASDRLALLVIFQALDAAGKDGAIAHVMSGVNPQGCEVHSFKHPSAEEQEHDFLWRTTFRLPRRGRIGIFNRSYYEEVLIVRVHPEILKSELGEKKPPSGAGVWRKRFHSIRELEKHLHRNGTRIVKFYLHLSKEEQRKRFIARIDDPDKNWKFGPADVAERQFWDDYIDAYEACLAATSTRHAPWYVVPADDKLNARLIVSRVILDLMEGLNLKPPRADAARRKELRAIRQKLVQSRP